jgi:AsmA protein
MNKALKILLGIVAALVLLLVLAAAAVALFFDPNDFRGRISAEVKKATGRELLIQDIRPSLFPTLGARIKNATFSNPEDYGSPNMAQVGEAEVGVKLLPLILHRQVQVSSVTLKDLQLELLRRADGQSNWDDLAGQKKPQAQPGQPQAPAGQGGGGLEVLGIGGVSIKNAAVRYTDQQAKKSYAVSKLDLSTGSIRPGKPFDVDLSFATTSADPELDAEVKASARLTLDTAAQLYQADKLKLDVDASGKTLPGGKQSASLSGSASYDGGQGAVKLSDVLLRFGSLEAAAALEGSGLKGKGEAGRLSGTLNVKSFSPRELLKSLGSHIETADRSALEQASLSARLDGNASSARLSELTLKLDQSTLTGSLGLRDFSSSAMEFALRLDQIDVDRYLAPNKPGGTPQQPARAGGARTELNATEIPIDALDKLNASGTLDIGSLKAHGLAMSHVRLKLAAVRGAEKRAELAADLYGGSIASALRATPGTRPGYGVSSRLVSVNVGPMLRDFLNKDLLSGTGNVSFELSSSGRTVGDVRRALNGPVSFRLANGAIKGVNLAQIIRQGQALLSGQPFNESAPQQTDFSELAMTGRITNGIFNDALSGASPLFRLAGDGAADLVNETVDYTLKPTVVNTATGQGGKELANLNGVTIPVRITGPWSALRYTPDLQSALQQKATEKLRDRLNEQIQKKFGNQPDNPLTEGLNRLFGKPKQDEQQPKQ